MKSLSRQEYNASIKFYDKIINTFNADFILYKSAIQSLTPKTLLEVGCGMGRLFLLYQGISEIYGMDISEEMIACGKEKFPDIHLFVDDMRTFHLNKKMDMIVVSNALLKHIEKETDRVLILKNLKNHLSDKGVIVFDHSDYLYYEQETTGWIPAETSVISQWIPNENNVLYGFQWKKTISGKTDKVHWRYLDNGRPVFEVAYTTYIYLIQQLKKDMERNGLVFERLLTDYGLEGLKEDGPRFIAIAGVNKKLIAQYKQQIIKTFITLCE
jgi:SAM-dependent methyltransferase